MLHDHAVFGMIFLGQSPIVRLERFLDIWHVIHLFERVMISLECSEHTRDVLVQQSLFA